MQPATDASARFDYRPDADRWDECVDRDGATRDGWDALLGHLGRIGPVELNQRWERCRRVIRDNGVTYNLFRDGAAGDRPWQIDPVPLVIGPAEWALIERGVAQRALALDGFLADAYGPQRLVRDGVVPPGLVLAHPQFLRPMHGVAVPGGARLHVYACELVRGGDGAWRVAADFAQAPAGAGYLLENRIVLSRALPEPFRELRVQRLAGFFLRLRQCLLSLAPRARDNPRVVLLTPGPYSETYFEHAYLAQYLGITLAQGDDLAVRDGRCCLKTLGGLVPVDVVLRRLADDYCDPLELRADSTLGVLGLVDAVRAGAVAVANALGSGLADSPALGAYMPGICRALLGEEPLIAGAQAWWGGEHAERIIAELPRLLLRPAWNNRGRPVVPSTMAPSELVTLAEDIRVRPHAYVAAERAERSSVPCWDGQRLRPRALTLRVFAVRDGDGYAVMPGGLARVDDGDDGGFWFERGGDSKDTWVLADHPVPEITLLRHNESPVELRRGGIELPSRVADHLFWLGRYAERVEDAARLVRSALALLAEDAGEADQAQIAAYLAMLARAHGVHAPAREPASAALVGLIADGGGGPLREMRDHLRRTASGVSDRLSADTWRALTALDAELAAEGGEDANQAMTRLNRVVIACAALAGMARENTTRGPGWRFLDLGRRIERALFGVHCLSAAFTAPHRGEAPALEALLRVADSAITYRSRYLTSLRAAPVVDLLLTDRSNPRAVAFQAAQIAEHVANLPRETVAALPTTPERLATRLQTAVGLADPMALSGPIAGEAEALTALLDDMVEILGALSDAVTTVWLTHVAPHRPFARDGGSP